MRDEPKTSGPSFHDEMIGPLISPDVARQTAVDDVLARLMRLYLLRGARVDAKHATCLNSRSRITPEAT